MVLVKNDEQCESSENTEHTEVTISDSRKEDPLFIVCFKIILFLLFPLNH